MSHSRVLGDAAHHLRILHKAERLHALGDEDGLVSLFAGVDPVEVFELASCLEVLKLLPDSGGEPVADSSNPLPGGGPLPPVTAQVAHPTSEPSPPVLSFHPESRRV